MSECSSKGTCGKSSCEGCSQNTAKGPQSMQVKENAHSRVKKVIGVVSGKGGVGKSMVTSLLAVAMNRKGYKTAIMDADITGPSIPTAFGLNDHAVANDDGLLPEVTKNGIKVMSLNLLLEDQTDPVVWRGPIISGTVSQFWTEVCWGDVTVFQSLPLAGIVIVTSPQELVSMIVTKAVKMAEMMNVPVLGIVENMSYFVCPDCGKKHFLFGTRHIEKVAAEHGISVIDYLPLDPKMAALCDEGKMEEAPEGLLEKMSSSL